jgi:hypothetical protein
MRWRKQVFEMSIFRNKRSGNKYTFISIVMILTIIYIFRLGSPQEEAAYPDIIQYGNLRYIYMDTVNSSPIMFVRKKPASEQGYMILARRGISILEEVYIYEGHKKYRRYVVIKE